MLDPYNGSTEFEWIWTNLTIHVLVFVSAVFSTPKNQKTKIKIIVYHLFILCAFIAFIDIE